MSVDRLPKDAKYCPSCGEPLEGGKVSFYGDNLLNRYRASFECVECGYSGEVVREGGLDDLTVFGEDTLWCGRHDQYEPVDQACENAFDPDDVDWLVDEENEEVSNS